MNVHIVGNKSLFKSKNAITRFKKDIKKSNGDEKLDPIKYFNENTDYTILKIGNDIKINLNLVTKKIDKSNNNNNKKKLRDKLKQLKNQRNGSTSNLINKIKKNIPIDVLKAFDQINKIFDVELPKPDEVFKNPDKYKALIQAYASKYNLTKDPKMNKMLNNYFTSLAKMLKVEYSKDQNVSDEYLLNLINQMKDEKLISDKEIKNSEDIKKIMTENKDDTETETESEIETTDDECCDDEMKENNKDECCVENECCDDNGKCCVDDKCCDDNKCCDDEMKENNKDECCVENECCDDDNGKCCVDDKCCDDKITNDNELAKNNLLDQILESEKIDKYCTVYNFSNNIDRKNLRYKRNLILKNNTEKIMILLNISRITFKNLEKNNLLKNNGKFYVLTKFNDQKRYRKYNNLINVNILQMLKNDKFKILVNSNLIFDDNKVLSKEEYDKLLD